MYKSRSPTCFGACFPKLFKEPKRSNISQTWLSKIKSKTLQNNKWHASHLFVINTAHLGFALQGEGHQRYSFWISVSFCAQGYVSSNVAPPCRANSWAAQHNTTRHSGTRRQRDTPPKEIVRWHKTDFRDQKKHTERRLPLSKQGTWKNIPIGSFPTQTAWCESQK